MAEGVTTRDYVDAALVGLHRRIDDLLSVSQRERDQAGAAIEKRLDEASHERDRIREAHGQFVTRVEFDLLTNRTGKLETSMARVYAGLGVIVFVVSAIGVLVKFLTG